TPKVKLAAFLLNFYVIINIICCDQELNNQFNLIFNFLQYLLRALVTCKIFNNILTCFPV
ncbi:MAG: hypothetical protein VR67_12600, partial [Peptococcaceae bacterium BRH_c8a]